MPNPEKGILIMSSNFNGSTIKNILSIGFDACCREKYEFPNIDKVLFLETTSNLVVTYNGVDYSSSEAYKQILLDLDLPHIEIRTKYLKDTIGDIPAVILSAVREVGKENVWIDLTSGKKDLTGSLYTAATLSGIRNITYTEVKRKNGSIGPFYDLSAEDDKLSKFNFLIFQSLEELQALAFINEKEFIEYKKQIEDLENRFNNTETIARYCSLLNSAVNFYFQGTASSYLSATQNIGQLNEMLVKAVACALATEVLGESVDNPLGKMEQLRRKRNKLSSDISTLKGKKNKTVKDQILLDQNEEELRTLPNNSFFMENAPIDGVYTFINLCEDVCLKDAKKGIDNRDILPKLSPLFFSVGPLSHMLETLRSYRTLTAHPSLNKNYVFQRDDAKLVINIAFKVLIGISHSDYAEKIIS